MKEIFSSSMKQYTRYIEIRNKIAHVICKSCGAKIALYLEDRASFKGEILKLSSKSRHMPTIKREDRIN